MIVDLRLLIRYIHAQHPLATCSAYSTEQLNYLHAEPVKIQAISEDKQSKRYLTAFVLSRDQDQAVRHIEM